MAMLPVFKPIPRVASNWNRADHWGEIKCRLSNRVRMNYMVNPGLYQIGFPDTNAPVLISANYKLSFDKLRRSLRQVDAWLLVLDTKGINVWCAAGKGTFGTQELIARINSAALQQVVSHRRIIVPQLGAPGVSAHQVKKATGFRVVYGPTQARMLPAFLRNGQKATAQMRRMPFSLVDRLVLTPIEVLQCIRKAWLYIPLVLLFFGLAPQGIMFKPAWGDGHYFLLLGIWSMLVGAVLTPLLLPFIPVRAFALKGWLTGLLGTLLFQLGYPHQVLANTSLLTATYLFFPAVSSYLAYNFTGCTTFTNKSGVKKELKIAVPLYLAAAVLTLIFVSLYKLSQWGWI
jgi:hypothetical protein